MIVATAIIATIVATIITTIGATVSVLGGNRRGKESRGL